jgi:hypothetical protein
MSDINYIAPLIPDQFPIDYQENGPMFVNFMQVYYQWLETQNNVFGVLRNLLNTDDIDRTADDFVVFFKEKYLKGIKYNTDSNIRTLIKNSLPFWRAKGTERAIDLFFQLIYGEDASIYYPSSDILKVSDGQWVIPIYLEVSNSILNQNYINKQIVGIKSGATAYVERFVIKNVGSKIINIFFISDLIGNFQTGEQLALIGNSSLTDVPIIIGSLTNLDIVLGGINFNVGDVVQLINQYDITQGSALVTGVSEITGVVDFALIDGGFGYTSNSIPLISENILFLSNVIITNTALGQDFIMFETISQPIANIEFNSLTNGTFTANETIFTYYANNSIAGEAIILSVTQNVADSNGNLLVEQTFGNIALGNTEIYLSSNSGASANITLFTDMNITANIMGISSNSTLFLTNATGWVSGLVATQHNGTGIVSGITQIGSNTLIFVVNTTGIFTTNTTIVGKNSSGNNISNGYLHNLYTSVGIINASGTFLNAASYPLSFIIGDNSNTRAVLNSISQGVDATFNISVLTNLEQVSIFTDYLAGNNINGIPYIELALNGSNSGEDANGYGFPRLPLGNLYCSLISCLSPFDLSIGTIGTLTNINPSENYNISPFVTIIEPLIADMGIRDYVINISNTSSNFIVGEIVTETIPVLNSATLTVNNVTAPIYNMSIISAGTGYTNGDHVIAVAPVSGTNAQANIVTNGSGNILTLTITNYGNGFVLLSTPNIHFTNSSGGTSGGNTTANVIANVASFIIGEPVYQSNGSANVSTGILQYSNLNIFQTLQINSIIGTPTITNNIIGMVSNAQANVIAVNNSIYSLTATGIVKTNSNTTTLYVKRITLGSSFLTNNRITGTTSGSIANVISISSDLTANVIGFNAIITANVETAGGSVSNLIVTDSGFGYADSDIINFLQLDKGIVGTAKAVVLQQGIGSGYYVSTKGFLDADKYIQDGYFYQLYSYEIRTRVALAQYADIIKKVLHVAGTKLFGAVYLASNNESIIEVVNPLYQKYIVTVGGASSTPTTEIYIGDNVYQTNTNNMGNVISIDSKVTINGSNTFYEVGTIIYENNVASSGIFGGLDNLSINTTANTTTLYLSNVQGFFNNTSSSNVYGLNIRQFNYSIVERLTLLSTQLNNIDPTTGSFTIGEIIFTASNTAIGVVLSANTSVIDVSITSGTFSNTGITGLTSGATGIITKFTGVSFNTNNTIYQPAINIQLVDVINFNNTTNSFQVNEIVYQKEKNVKSSNAITQNTFYGIIESANATMAIIAPIFGYLANNSSIYGTLVTASNGVASAIINNIEMINTAVGIISSINSTTVKLTNVSGIFKINRRLWSNNTIANTTTQLANLFSNSTINTAINTIEFYQTNGSFIATTNSSTLLISQNTGATANILNLKVRNV